MPFQRIMVLNNEHTHITPCFRALQYIFSLNPFFSSALFPPTPNQFPFNYFISTLDSEVSLVNTHENLIVLSQFSVPVRCLNIPLRSWDISSQWCKMSAKCVWRMSPRLKVTTSNICMSGASILSFNRSRCLLTWAELPQCVSEDVTPWKTFPEVKRNNIHCSPLACT